MSFHTFFSAHIVDFNDVTFLELISWNGWPAKYRKPFLPNVPFSSPWTKVVLLFCLRTTKGFLMFSGGSKENIGKKRIATYFQAR